MVILIIFENHREPHWLLSEPIFCAFLTYS